MKRILHMLSLLLKRKHELLPESEYLGYEAYSMGRVQQEVKSAATTSSKSSYRKAA